jgi:methionine-rich copper-binding protein CopC
MIRLSTFPVRAVAVLGVIGAIALTPSVTRGSGARRHVHLVKSEPAANDTIVAPAVVRLWFSEKVELKITTVKLRHSAGGVVTMGKVTRSGADDGAPLVAPITGALAPGAYVVNWSTAADDGHPSKGAIDFVVKSAR